MPEGFSETQWSAQTRSPIDTNIAAQQFQATAGLARTLKTIWAA
jgi:hypothetical protein